MKVPSPTEGRTRPSGQGLGYLRPDMADLSPIFQGLNSIANAAQDWATRNEAEARQTQNLKSLQGLSEWQIKMDDMLTQEKQNLDPADANFDQRWEAQSQNEAEKFIAQQPPELQEQMRYRTSAIRQGQMDDVRRFVGVQRRAYADGVLDKSMTEAELGTQGSPDRMQDFEKSLHEKINSAPGYSRIEKADKRAIASNRLHLIKYQHDVIEQKRLGFGAPPPAPEVVQPDAQQPDQVSGDHPTPQGTPPESISRVAKDIGANPLDLATVIAYETAGSFSPDIRGGAGGRYAGLIQFGPAERRKYGIKPGMTFSDQMQAVGQYLKDRGFKPGMGILDLYSTINAGEPGHYNASDRPGYTVQRHVKEMSTGSYHDKAKSFMAGQTGIKDIDADPTYADLTFEQRMAARKDADTQFNQQQAAQDKQWKENVSAFHDAANLDAYTGKLGHAGAEALYAADEDGVWDYAARKQLDDIIKTHEAEGASARDFAAKLSDQGRGGFSVIDGTNEEDKKGANNWVGPDGIAKLGSADRNYAERSFIPMVKTGHYIPTEGKGTLEAMTRSTDINKKLYAIDVLGQIQDAEPKAFDTQVDKKVAADVDYWRTQKEYRTPEELRAGLEGGRTTEQRQANIVLKEQAEQAIKDGKGPALDEVLKSYSPNNGWWGSPPTFGVDPTQAALANRELNALFVEEYPRYGNPEDAKAAAVKRWSRLWDTTSIGGKNVLMKYPPQKVGYRAVGAPGSQDYSYIERQVRNELNIPPEQGLQLISDDQTEQEYFASQVTPTPGQPAPLPPSYQVLRIVDGTYYLETLADGRTPNRRHFTITSAEKGFEEHQYTLDDARERLRQFNESIVQPTLHGRGPLKTLPKDIQQEWEQKKREVQKLEATTPLQKELRDINNKVGHEFPVRPAPPALPEKQPNLYPQPKSPNTAEERAKELRRKVREMLDNN